jgi:upper collar protein
MSYKNYKRHLGKIELNKETVERNRLAFFEFYFNYFYNIVVNYFTWEGLPNDIDELFIERKLIENGHVSFFHDDTFGFIAQGGTRGERLNHYDQPLSYQPVNVSSMNYFKQMEIAYTENDFNVIETLHKDNPDKIKKPCIVIPNNNFYEPYIGYLELFCEKLADIELTIQLNRNAQITPYFIFVDNNSVLSMKNIFNKIANFEPVVYLNKQKDQDGQDSFKQLSDYIQVFRTDAPFLLDKLHDEKLRVMNQLLTFIGINNNPSDKKERLVVSEAISNNGVISANIEVGWKSRRKAVDLINKCYGLEISVKPAETIQQFNLDKVALDIAEQGGAVFDPE